MTPSANVRVFLWTIPRSVSTAFTRSMESIKDVTIYLEPYTTAEHFGPEGRAVPNGVSPSEMEYTFDKVKAMLEDKALDNNVVFVKDMGYAVDKRYDKIANGYKHSFLIRHPAKSFTSFYKIMTDAGKDSVTNIASWLSEGLGYKELWELFKHIEKEQETRPIVINSDQLLEDPKYVLKKYCEAVGLEYNDDLLSWEPKPKEKWNRPQTARDQDKIYNWFSNSLTSVGFKKSLSNPPPAMEDMPKIVQECVQKSMPYYEKLNAHCIGP